MKTLAILLLLLICGFESPLNAQDNFDCINAIEVCDADNIMIQRDHPVGGSVDENIDGFCMIPNLPISLENNTIWLKYHFQSEGDFLFTITPSEFFNDIDFVAFRSSTQNCENLTSIRCMFSGEIIGGPTDSLCLGATGLSSNSIDTFENAGCNLDSDNFLAPINVQSNDVIYLAIISWDTSFQYTIEHQGSAMIGCETLATETTQDIGVKIYPNPMKTDFWIKCINNHGAQVFMETYNHFGNKVLSNSFTASTNVDLKAFPNGIYYVKIFMNEQVFINKVLKME